MLLLNIHHKASSHPECTPAVEKQNCVPSSPHSGSVLLVLGASPGREKLGLPRVVTYTMTGREKGTKAAGGLGSKRERETETESERACVCILNKSFYPLQNMLCLMVTAIFMNH